MNLIEILNSKVKDGSVYRCDLGFYVKKYKGYLLRLTYSEGWKYCSIHSQYVEAKYNPVSNREFSKVIDEYEYIEDEGYESKFLCKEANSEFLI